MGSIYLCMSLSVFCAIFFTLRHFLENRILDGIPQSLFKTFGNGSKLLHMVQNCLWIKWKLFGNIIKLMGHNLENTEFLTGFRGTCPECEQPIPNS